MKAHLINTHVVVPRSRPSVNVEVKYPGHNLKKNGCCGGILVSLTHLVFYFTLTVQPTQVTTAPLRLTTAPKQM